MEREQAQPAITELKNPLKRFQDDRLKIYQTMPNNYYRVMSDKELFDAFTVSSPENITVNTITTVTIKNINSRQIFAEHSSGIDAVTPNVEEQVASLLARENAPQDRDGLKGTPQDCVIKEIILPLLQIVVSYNAEDIKGARDRNIILEDNTYFDILGEEAAIKEKEEKSKNVFCRYARRAIQHKDFRDITAAQAESELQTKQIGAAIFRPSSKGNEHLSLTIHFPNNKFAHYDIVERNKRNPDALGDELWIRDMSFSDLEEIKKLTLRRSLTIQSGLKIQTHAKKSSRKRRRRIHRCLFTELRHQSITDT